ncbi:MAG: PSD1 and planctomycete cytochrome C domain-containing protein [Planctomycetota bacterium]
MIRGFLGICSFIATLSVAFASDTEKIQFFENQIRPILVEHCYDCHSGDDVEAGLWLDSRGGWKQGGDSGPAIIPGDVDKSLIVDAVRYTEDRVSGMPPDSKLSDAQINAIETWVADGAEDPRDEQTAKASEFNLAERFESHWSWRPIGRPPAPAVMQSDWPKNDIDRFILHKIEAAGLHPTAEADRSTWLRRVYYDLIGLPPSVEELEAFEADHSADAFERVVDRLLDSEHFGEKWARHWMDLVRFAETYGHEFDYPIDHAAQYRDYLIRAFNADVPYDQFVREHVAGDLIHSPRRHPNEKYNESIIGTGYWYLHEATHAPTDVLQNEADIVSNQLDVFGTTFLGLTIACARCHDHKFDAISTADYYALSGYLQSSCRQNFPLDPGGQNAAAVKEIESIREEIASALLSDPYWQDFVFQDKAKEMVDVSALDQHQVRDYKDENARLLVDFDGTCPDGWTTTGLAFAPVNESLVYAASTTGRSHLPGTMDSGVYGAKSTGILRSPTFELTGRNVHVRMRSDANIFVRLVIDNYQLAPMNALLFRGTFLRGKETDTGGKWVWKTLGGDTRKYLGHKCYLEFIDENNAAVAVDQIWVSDGGPPKEVNNDFDLEEAWAMFPTRLADTRSSALLRSMMTLEEGLPASVDAMRDRLKKAMSDVRPARFVIAMGEGTREDGEVYIRGSHTNRGAPVPPRNLEVLGGKSESRLELAQSIASIDNPLTARVLVNRVWHHLFGRGIVPSVDDFGPQGIAPTHPQLLDHLATEFAEDGWSLKRLMRRMVLSGTYRQATTPHAETAREQLAAKDPTNSLLSYMRVRRLPAESIRDGMLAISGRLDSRLFGASVATHRTPFMTGRGGRKSGPLDGDGRRTIYLSIYRNFLNPFLVTFDMPNPFGPKGRRSVSNVPAQSLAMMNDPFVIDQAKVWAKRMLREETDPRERIKSMVRQAHGQTPTSESIDRLVGFVDQQSKAHGGDETAAWNDLAHTLWNMKAFVFLR